MTSIPNKKLGKKNARFDQRTFKLSKYLKATALPPVPPATNWMTKVSNWPMYSNDTLGDCAEACVGHMIQLWDSYSNPTEAAPTDAQIVQAYSDITGYNPDDPSSDQGTDLLDMLNYWRNTGIAGHKILAYVSLTPGSLHELRLATSLFGCVMIGIQLPITAQNQTTAWKFIDNTGDGLPGSWGGHCIPCGAYNSDLDYLDNTVVTWGETLLMGNEFYQFYNDESYAVLTQDWIDQNGMAPSDFDLAALQADLASL